MNRTFSIAIAAAALLTTACAGDEQPQTAGTANGFAAPTKSGTLAKGREVVFTDDMIAGLVSETSQLLFSAGIEPGELLDDDDTALFTFGDSVPLRLPVTRELPDTKEQRLLYIHRGVGYSYFVFGGAEDEAWSRFVAHLSATGRIITLPDPPAPSDPGDNPADGFLPQSPWENCGEMALTRLPVEALRTPLDSERLYIVRAYRAGIPDRDAQRNLPADVGPRPNGRRLPLSGACQHVRNGRHRRRAALRPRTPDRGARGGSFRIRSGVLTRLRFSRQPQQAGPSVLPAAFHRSKIMRTFAAGLSLLSWIETEMKSGCGTGSTAR